MVLYNVTSKSKNTSAGYIDSLNSFLPPTLVGLLILDFGFGFFRQSSTAVCIGGDSGAPLDNFGLWFSVKNRYVLINEKY